MPRRVSPHPQLFLRRHDFLPGWSISLDPQLVTNGRVKLDAWSSKKTEPKHTRSTTPRPNPSPNGNYRLNLPTSLTYTVYICHAPQSLQTFDTGISIIELFWFVMKNKSITSSVFLMHHIMHITLSHYIMHTTLLLLTILVTLHYYFWQYLSHYIMHIITSYFLHYYIITSDNTCHITLLLLTLYCHITLLLVTLKRRFTRLAKKSCSTLSPA